MNNCFLIVHFSCVWSIEYAKIKTMNLLKRKIVEKYLISTLSVITKVCNKRTNLYVKSFRGCFQQNFIITKYWNKSVFQHTDIYFKRYSLIDTRWAKNVKVVWINQNRVVALQSARMIINSSRAECVIFYAYYRLEKISTNNRQEKNTETKNLTNKRRTHYKSDE